MMELINGFISVLDKNLVVGFLSISLAANVFIFRLYLKTNMLYIGVLMDNVKITEKINAIMKKLMINSEISSDTPKPKEIEK